VLAAHLPLRVQVRRKEGVRFIQGQGQHLGRSSVHSSHIFVYLSQHC